MNKPNNYCNLCNLYPKQRDNEILCNNCYQSIIIGTGCQGENNKFYIQNNPPLEIRPLTSNSSHRNNTIIGTLFIWKF